MAAYKEEMEQLLQKEMTRKEFLSTLGLALLSLFGVGRFLSHFFKDRPVESSNPTVYGGGNYGLRRESR